MNKLKINLVVLFAIIIGVGFVGCEKEMLNTQKEEENAINNKNSIVQVEDFKMQVNNNMLVFETVEDYEKALNYLTKIEADDFKGWDSKLTFTSMRKECESKKMTEEEMPINDNVLASMLNQNAEIQIQGKIFILLPKTEQVIVYDNFKNYSNKTNAREYTFDDEVITEEFGFKEDEEIVEEMQNESNCADCKATDDKGKYCKSKNSPSTPYKNNIGNNQWTKCQIQYNKFGIYYKLKGKIWRNWKSGEIIAKCSSTSTYSHKNGSGTMASGAIVKSWGKTANLVLYSGRFRLKNYSFSVKFEVDDQPSHNFTYSKLSQCSK